MKTTLWLVPTLKELAHLMPDLHVVPTRGLNGRGHRTGTGVDCGIGPAAAAQSATVTVPGWVVDRVSLAGIAGAFPESGLEPGMLVQARSERFADLGYREGDRYVDLDAMGLDMLPRPGGALGCQLPAEPLFDDLPTVDFLTVSQITNSRETARALYGTYGAAVENMEGAGVALAARHCSVTFHEVRAISNLVGPREPKSWCVEEPLRKLGEMIRAL